MATKKPTTSTPAKVTEPPAEKVVEPTAEEIKDVEIARDELLAGVPELRPAARFRLVHRHAFNELSLLAVKNDVNKFFDRVREESTDPKNDSKAALIESMEGAQKFAEFVAEIDLWAESIAVDPAEYEKWALSLEEPATVLLLLYMKYQEDLGE